MSRFLKVLCCLGLLGLPLITSPALAVSSDLIELNNQAVESLQRGEFAKSETKFKSVLSRDASYDNARRNYSVCHNDWAVHEKAKLAEAIYHLHQACYLDPLNTTVQVNLAGLITRMHKDPYSFADRIRLAEDARHRGDLVGALVEYKAALELKSDGKVRQMLGQNSFRELNNNYEKRRFAAGLWETLPQLKNSKTPVYLPSYLPTNSFKTYTNAQLGDFEYKDGYMVTVATEPGVPCNAATVFYLSAGKGKLLKMPGAGKVRLNGGRIGYYFGGGNFNTLDWSVGNYCYHIAIYQPQAELVNIANSMMLRR